MLEWAIENGCPWHPETTASAAAYDLEQVGKEKKENGEDWMRTASFDDWVKLDHFEVLRWVLQNGCPWHPEVMHEALR